ncbi:MAG: hypothetical protein GY832_18005 [Chloroflexi bacterium]|nr:hypothetical protein [Chloroflexota bacterium]
MTEETIIDEKVEQEPKVTQELEPEKDTQSDATPEAKTAPAAESDGSKKKSASESLKDAWKQVFGQALGVALKGRGNVVMVRVNDDALHHLDMLVEAEITKSRSESAAFLINEGITANQGLFDCIGEIAQQIIDLRTQLREQVQREIQKKE